MKRSEFIQSKVQEFIDKNKDRVVIETKSCCYYDFDGKKTTPTEKSLIIESNGYCNGAWLFVPDEDILYVIEISINTQVHNKSRRFTPYDIFLINKNRKCYRSYMSGYYNRIDDITDEDINNSKGSFSPSSLKNDALSNIWNEWSLSGQHNSILADSTKEILKNFLMKDEEWYEFNKDYISLNTIDGFKDALKMHHKPISQKKQDFTDSINKMLNNISTIDGSAIRYDEWLIFKQSEIDYNLMCLLYNTETNKKYMFSRYNDTWHQCICNVFDYFSRYFTESYRFCNVIEGESYALHKPLKFYNKSGRLITPEDFYKGTYVEQLVSYFKNCKIIYKICGEKNPKYNYYTSKVTEVNEISTTENELVADSITPLFINDKYKTIVEQLIKCQYFNILSILEMNRKMFEKIDTSKTNLSKIFSLTNHQLSIYDNMFKTKRLTDNSLNPLMIWINTLGDKIKSISDDDFTKLLDLDDRYAEVYQYFQDKTIKEFLKIAEKYTNPSYLQDYLNMREQVIRYQNENTNQIDINNYPKLPGKSVVHMRWDAFTRSNKYCYQYCGYICYDSVPSINQYFTNDNNELIPKGTDYYQHVKIVSNNVVEITLSPSENVKYLHNDIQNFFNLIKDAYKNDMFKEAIKRVEKYEYEDDKLMIVAPKVTQDIQKEGMTLGHCVSSFIDPIINNKENVLFLRRKDMPEEPYYTIAIDNMARIEQIHCYRNGDLTENGQKSAYQNSGMKVYDKIFDIVGFIRKWCNARGLDKSTVRESYGALGAHR